MGTRDRTTAVSANARYPYRAAPAMPPRRGSSFIRTPHGPGEDGPAWGPRRAAPPMPRRPPSVPRRSELRAHAQVELPAVLVERARLGCIERVILERRIIQVLSVEVHAQVLVVRPGYRCRERTDRVLRERRTAIQAAE